MDSFPSKIDFSVFLCGFKFLPYYGIMVHFPLLLSPLYEPILWLPFQILPFNLALSFTGIEQNFSAIKKIITNFVILLLSGQAKLSMVLL